MSSNGETSVVKKSSKKPAKNSPSTSRKGAMKGKGGPENASCRYKGVRQRVWGKWVAEIRQPNCKTRLWLGTFNSSYEAAVAYDAAARRLYKSAAVVNFPDITAMRAPQTVVFPPLPLPCPRPRIVSVVYSTTDSILTAVPLGPEIPAMPRDYRSTMKAHIQELPEVDDSDIWDAAKAGTTFDEEITRRSRRVEEYV